MRLPWLSIGILAVSAALFAQPFPQNAPPAQSPFPQGPVPQAGGGPQDEPGRAVARLGILNGDASIRRGDASEWEAAAVNAPLMSGDQLSVAAGSRAEVQFDAAHFARIAGDTELRLADIENGHFQIQMSHGLITWRVLRDLQSQAEISTPLVAVHPGRQSVVRVEVTADGVTHVTVRRGEAQVSTQKGSETVSENTTMDIRGSIDDPEFQVAAAAPRDEWDNWSDQRDNYLTRAQAPRYVPQGVSGVEDLDAYGHWAYDPAYGWVWMPTVASSWAPYQDGQWVWEDYYGWTWVDYEPWGWAPFHYGSWYNRAGLGWAWYPGARLGRTWWRPAMVGFFGWGGGGIGFGVGFGFGNIGWVPLAPFEVFHPWYGRGGFGGAAALNAGIVRNANVLGTFRNAGVANGVTAVSAADFQRGNFRNTVAVDRGVLQQASLVRGGVPVTPTTQNLRFSNRTASVQTPHAGAASQRFFGSSAAAANAANANAQRTPFAQQQAAVRSAVGAQSQAAAQGRSQSQQPQTATQSRAASAAPGWQRFEGASNSTSPSSRGAAPGANATPGYNRFSTTPNSGGQSAQPRQFQVSPSIVRQRPAAPAGPQYQYSAPQQAHPQQQAPAQGSGYGSQSAPRSAPAGGSRSSGSRSSGRR